MPTVEEYLRSTERPQHRPLPPPVAVALPVRVRRQASATRPRGIRRPFRGRPHPKLRGALGVAMVAGAFSLGIYGAAHDDHGNSRNDAPVLVTIPTLPPFGSLPALTCPASQAPGLTATEDVVIALVQIRAAATVNPLAGCARHVWPTDSPLVVDEFSKLGVVRSPIAITEIDGPPNAVPGAIVHFTLSNDGARWRLETQFARSADDREWRLAYLRAIPA